MKSGVFIERDALLNLATRGGQQKTPFTIEEFHVNDSVLAPVQRLKAAGYVVIVTTNQPEISRGNLSRREMDLMHHVLRVRLPLDEIMVCPHEESDACPCRKPRPGLLHEAAFKWHLELGLSFVISHRWPDADAARVVGATSVMIRSPWLGRVHCDSVSEDFAGAVERVLEDTRIHKQVA